ncbi:trypsin-like serine protease [Brucella haematophila]|uniref:trypsin-like serine protease n=1 Tax=Brucella haematophila TaxID=419474 RepID=UPI00110D493C|nr:trypsin-like serine protease [Brucella haematophila]TMV01228.1 S1 family peptidase [Brucella haematophila]
MKKGSLCAGLIASLLLFLCSNAYSLVIDEATFKYYGGDTADIEDGLKTHNDKLREFSYETPWLAVGNIGECTATWLGDEAGWSYILTAAHCSGYQGTDTPYEGLFWAWDGTIIASGEGRAYVPPQRVNVPTGMGGASTDIAILKLPSKNPIVDAAGQPIERPILNDALDEEGRDVIFAGYGTWGVGLNQSSGYWPEKGERRLYARSRIDSIFELEYGIGASYQPDGPSASWARVAAGDSGSAWWQIRGNHPVIIATTNGGGSKNSTGARVSKYVDWIKSIYPNARFLSNEKPQGCIVTLNTDLKYCLPIGEKISELPPDFYGQEIYVDAGPDTTVMLSDYENLAYNRLAEFHGTVLNDELKSVEANNGQVLDFSRPHSMQVLSNTIPVSCIISLTSSAQYCRTIEQDYPYSLPSWIYGHEVQVQAAPETMVRLSDWDNLSYNRIADFSGFVQNWDLKRVEAHNGINIDFSRPYSMRVLRQVRPTATSH